MVSFDPTTTTYPTGGDNEQQYELLDEQYLVLPYGTSDDQNTNVPPTSFKSSTSIIETDHVKENLIQQHYYAIISRPEYIANPEGYVKNLIRERESEIDPDDFNKKNGFVVSKVCWSSEDAVIRRLKKELGIE